MNRKKILFVAGWRTEFGDFTTEHFKAASIHHDATYVFIDFQKKFSLFPFYRIEEKLVNNDPQQIIITISCYLRRLGMYAYLINKAIDRLIARQDRPFDLVHINVRTPVTEVLVINKHLRDTPKVLTEHNTFYHTKINTQFPDPKARAREKERVVNWLIEADHTYVLPVSRQLGDVLVRDYGVPAERIRVVPNVAASDYLAPTTSHSPVSGNVRLLLVAFWNYPKNLMLFAHALAKLDRKELDRLEVDLVGDGDLVPGFMQFVKEHLPSLKLTWHGFVSDTATLSGLYRAVDYLVHPSDAENLPCVIIESLCCGTPVLSNDINGVSELIDHEVNGFLSPKGDVESFAMYLRRIIDGKVTFDRGAIHQRAAHRYSAEEVGRSLSNIYLDALAIRDRAVDERPYQQCTRCLLDTTDDKSIQFDEAGVCTYCHRYRRLERARLHLDRDRTKELDEILARIKRERRNTKYDCLLGVSGGVDSTFVAIKLKERGLNPLLVHLDNGWNSELSVKNIQSIVDQLHLDLHTYVIEWSEFRDIQLAFLRASVVDIELVTDHAIVACLYNLANKLGIKHIISGDNFATEGVMPRGWTHEKGDLLNIRHIARHFSGRQLRSYPRLSYLRRQYLILFKGIKVIPLLNYMDFDKAKAKEEITVKLGWKDYGTKHGESIFTRFYQNHILPTKFHVDKRKAHLSALICSGQLDRSSALEELRKDLYPERELRSDLDFVTKKLGITHEEFDAIMKSPIHRHMDYPSYVTAHYRWEQKIRMQLRPVVNLIKRVTGFRHESNYV